MKSSSIQSSAEKAKSIRRALVAAYEQERHREKERNYQFFRSGAGRLWRRLDVLLDKLEKDDSDHGWVSDGGLGVNRMLDAIDGDRTLLRRAYYKVRRRAPHALATFKLILRYGSNRQKSIAALASSREKSAATRSRSTSFKVARLKYYRDRATLLKLFLQ